MRTLIVLLFLLSASAPAQKTPPSVLTKVDPEYSPEALKAKYSGSVMLSVMVNEYGEAEAIKVVKSLGMGLDEKAIEAVQKWRFTPATNNGVPVGVRAQIEINFRLPGSPPPPAAPPAQATVGPLVPDVTATTTHNDSRITATLNVAPGSETGDENYILHIHAEGSASYIRYILNFTLDDAPGTNRQTRGQRDGFVTRNSDGNIDVLIPTGGKLKACKITLNEEVPVIPRIP